MLKPSTMFEDAIDKIATFTRPVHSILRTYGGRQVIPGAATLFFVNELGFAITCRHVVEMLLASDNITRNYSAFREERSRLKQDGKFKSHLKALELKHKLNADTEIQLKYSFVDCLDSLSGFTSHVHPKYDLAIIEFKGFNKLHYTDYAVFKKDSSQIRQGEMLCRLGFPFPEFTNFSYNQATDDIEWTSNGFAGSPRFPIEGMITRFLGEDGRAVGIEMSTPGLRGQSGGPLFNKDGIIYGMQFSTKHLHLGFDMVDKEVYINNKAKKVSDYSFIHLGQCIHAEVIKEFLASNGVKYYER